MPKRWDEIEVRYLIKHAGRDTVADIASVLSRSHHDVRRECAIRGLNARAPRSAMVECPSCGKPRTRMARGLGVCRVCATESATRRTETMIALELASAPASVRAEYGRFMSRKGRFADPPAWPVLPGTSRMTPAERQRAYDAHDAAIERCEWIEARREYDAARARLHRLRVAMNGGRR